MSCGKGTQDSSWHGQHLFPSPPSQADIGLATTWLAQGSPRQTLETTCSDQEPVQAHELEEQHKVHEALLSGAVCFGLEDEAVLAKGRRALPLARGTRKR